MNLIAFPVGSTNIFPIANSTAGGQLFTEWNLRTRESVPTLSTIEYMVGPSFVHSFEDFKVVSQLEEIESDVISSSTIVVKPGRGLINGHFVESLTDIVIDMSEINARLQLMDQPPYKGNLSIGLRVMYSTEATIAGTMLVENEDNYYEGIQIVILPTAEFKVPADVPTLEEQSLLTAHLKLADFSFLNGKVQHVKNNPDKIQMLPAERIGNADKWLDKTYVSKVGLDPKKLYVFSGQGTDSSGADTWCEAIDSEMVWDRHPKLAEGDYRSSTFPEASFVYNSFNDSLQLRIPHKQVDGMSTQSGNPQYYVDKVLTIPKANLLKNLGGVVTKDYNESILGIQREVERFYHVSTGKFKAYVDVLTDRNNLPKVDSSWNPGDYIVVREDRTVTDNIGDSYPSTLYSIIPGIVQAVNDATGNNHVIITGTDIEEINDWNSMIREIVCGVSWNQLIDNQINALTGGHIDNPGDAFNPYYTEWSKFIRENLRSAVENLDNIDWASIIQAEVDQSKNLNWAYIMRNALESGETLHASEIEALVAKITRGTATDADKIKLRDYTDGLYDGVSPITEDQEEELLREFLRYYTTVNWSGTVSIQSIRNKIASGDVKGAIHDLADEIARSVAYESRSTIYWNQVIRDAVQAYNDIDISKISNASWNDVIANAIINSSGSFRESLRIAINKKVPTALKSGVCLSEINYDVLDTKLDVSEVLGYVTSGDVSELRGKVGVDYIRQIVNEEDGYHCYYFVVSQTSAVTELQPIPIYLTGQINYATESMIGGFRNVDESAVGNGYVRVNSEGNLQLVDYDLLATGVLAYQLGADYVVQSDTIEDIQAELDDFVNSRVAFKTDSNEAEPEINVYLTLPEVTQSGVINIGKIDSRFGAYLHLHIKNNTSANNSDTLGTIIINVYDCEKLKLDMNEIVYLPNVSVNLYRCNLYYDVAVLNNLAQISGLRLWYSKLTTGDPDVIVDGMTVKLARPMSMIESSVWTSTINNDNHYLYALNSLTFSDTGDVLACGVLVASNSTNNNMNTGTWMFSEPFVLPQDVGLNYPLRRMTSRMLIEGSFLHVYPNTGIDGGYLCEDVKFSALTNIPNSYTTSVYVSGTVNFLVTLSLVEADYASTMTGSIDAWDSSMLHQVYGLAQ